MTLVAKDDITAGDGAKHDVIPDKGLLANRTTCNVFRLLKACGLPVAFEEQDAPTSFIAPGCEMLPYEVVMRREAHGSYLKRHPHIAKGQLFPQLIVEFYLKTKDKDWKGKPLVADDPLMDFTDGGSQIRLFNPAKPVIGQEPFLVLPASDVFSVDDEWKIFPEMRRIARQVFLVLEKAWQLEGGTLVDLKVEFGYDTQGPPAARRRDRQRFLARDRERLLHRQAGLSRRRRARRRGREIPPRRRDHRPLPAAAPAHHPLARLGERQDRRRSRRRSAS